MHKEASRGFVKNALEDIGRQLHNRSTYFTGQLWNTLKDNENQSSSVSWGDYKCEYTFIVCKKREPRKLDD